MVYVDELRHYTGRGRLSGWWCHLTADTEAELHAMARRIGLDRSWFQPRYRLAHYDLRPSKRALAVLAGAVETTARQRLIDTSPKVDS